MSVGPVPRATARLQLHAGFGFADACAQVPYYARLGISHLYLSPILTARAGSTHGYDVVNYGAVNPELGGEEGLRALVAALRRHDMGVIVDIVPNHMAVGGADNPYWLDVLEWGRDSRYASFFDIDWEVPDPALNGRILAPFLGKPYGEALDDGELQLCFDQAQGRLHFQYYEHRFPLAPRSYAPVLRLGGDTLHTLALRFRDAARRNRATRGNAFEQVALEFAEATRSQPDCAAALQRLLAAFDPASPEGRTLQHQLLERQHYRLAWWRTAGDEINWRRFFDVIQLAGLRMQEAATFEIVHATTLRLYAQGLIDGLRIDHIDGLADPRQYGRTLRHRLRTLAGQRPPESPRGPAYVVVEKILAPAEKLPHEWQVDGTTGYNFMNDVGALLHDPDGEAELGRLWEEMSGSRDDFEAEERRARRRIPQELLSADFHACARALHAIARSDPRTRDWTQAAIRRVLAELLVEFPVYRSYADARGRSPEDQARVSAALAAAAPRCWPGDRGLMPLLDRWLGGEPPLDVHPAAARQLRLRAIARFQQLTSPVAAKSVEDTAFYRHGRLLSRNEVGASPAQFATTVDDFHTLTRTRQRRYPNTMLATATHDHKRGEDTRARITVLSSQATLWADTVRRWHRQQEPRKPLIDGVRGPDAADESMLYQMLLGAWPLNLQPHDTTGLDALRARIDAWGRKAVRESKRRSGWIEPNEAYEAACTGFLEQLLNPQHNAGFLRELHTLVQQLAPAGALNGLAQTLLRCCCPGVPDLYQGCEFWDFSLVDPDNRQPVDYAARQAALDSSATDTELLQNWRSGAIKQRLIARTLNLRARLPALFADGSYLPLTAHGPQAGRLVAFSRSHGDQALIVVGPRCASSLLASANRLAYAPDAWGSTRLRLPRALTGTGWRDALTGTDLPPLAAQPRLQTLLEPWPVALLVRGDAS